MLTEFAPLIWLVFATGVAIATPITVLRIRDNASEFRVVLPVLIAVAATFVTYIGVSLVSNSMEQMVTEKSVTSTERVSSL